MQTLDLDGQKVSEDVRFFVIGEDPWGFPMIRHASKELSDEEMKDLLVLEIYRALPEHDAPYRNGWLKGMLSGMAVTAVMWGALWVVGKLVFG